MLIKAIAKMQSRLQNQ